MRLARLIPLLLMLPCGLLGCMSRILCNERSCAPQATQLLGDCEELAAKIEYPDVERRGITGNLDSLPPRKLSDGIPTQYWVITLEECIRLGLENSDVLRDLGGRVLDFPNVVPSVFDPSIRMSHPRLGEEAVLGAFDPRWNQAYRYLGGHEAYNNIVAGDGSREVDREIFRMESELTKTAATGAQFAVRSVVEQQYNDLTQNLFSSIWSGNWEASIRQPLLQGAGVDFNRIIGPNGVVDLTLTRGVLLARIDGDVSMNQFEKGVRDYVSQLETAYWQLYFAYRNLEANRRGRDMARRTWQSVKLRNEADLRGGEADAEAQAREQLYQFEQQVVLSLNGTEDAGTPGVYQAERRLRRMLGLPVNDGDLMRPADEPTDAPIVFDWDSCLADALTRRVELREQMWRVKQRELELLAARNFLLPRVDALAVFRNSGFGDDLFGRSGPFASMERELSTFQNHQVEVGLQVDVPLGYRRQLAGVRHSELNLSRERAILRDQEHLISHNLAEAVANLETTFESMRLAYNRLIAANEVVESREAVFEAGKIVIENLLEGQRRLAEAQINYYRARLAHERAITNVHFQKGTLLAYNGVQIGEGSWCDRACLQFRSEGFRHRQTGLIDYRTMRSRISGGTYDDSLSASTEQLAPSELLEQIPAAPPYHQKPLSDGATVPDSTPPAEPLPAEPPLLDQGPAQPKALELQELPAPDQPTSEDSPASADNLPEISTIDSQPTSVLPEQSPHTFPLPPVEQASFSSMSPQRLARHLEPTPLNTNPSANTQQAVLVPTVSLPRTPLTLNGLPTTAPGAPGVDVTPDTLVSRQVNLSATPVPASTASEALIVPAAAALPLGSPGNVQRLPSIAP